LYRRKWRVVGHSIGVLVGSDGSCSKRRERAGRRVDVKRANSLRVVVGDIRKHRGQRIGGGIVSTFLRFTGFFLGVAFLVIGLLVGRNKEVVYARTALSEEQPATIVDTQGTPSRGAAATAVAKATSCPHCGGVVPIGQPQCNHCLNKILWIKGKAFWPSRLAE